MVARTCGTDRIEVRLPELASARQLRELGAFARYCVTRIQLGDRERWLIDVTPGPREYRASIAVTDGGVILEERGRGSDGPLAIWDAMCNLEQRLREHRARSDP